MEQQPRLPLWFLFANWALVVASFVLGVVLGGRRAGELPEPQATALRLAHAEILRSHVDQQDPNALLDVAIAAMVTSLDPYSAYVPPSRVQAYDERSSGQYEGVGLLMNPDGAEVVVQWPFPGGPAARAGVLPGDVIVAVDGVALGDVPAAERHEAARRRIRGEAGTEVRLGLERDGAALELSMRRGDVQRSAVKWAHFADPDRGLGYLHVTDFHPNVAAHTAAAIEALLAERPLRGLVLDLRWNGGGSLDECTAMANLFLPRGTIVSQRRRDSEIVETVTAVPERCRFPELPLVILVNGYSASASEVLAGALQDHGRAAIVGTPTFGKGFVNTVYSWKDLDFRLKLTTARFFTPNGRNLDGHHRRGPHEANGSGSAPPSGGIAPDVLVDLEQAAQEALERQLAQFEPPAQYLAAFRAVAARHGLAVPTPPDAAGDPQLAQALVTLRERVTAAGR